MPIFRDRAKERFRGFALTPTPIVDPMDLFRDGFTNPSANLENRLPDVGNQWWVSGGNAARVVVADGVMKQNGTGGGVGYAMTTFAETPGEIGCDFIWDGGLQPPVLALFPYSGSAKPDFYNPADARLVHIYISPTSLAPQIADALYFGDKIADRPFQWVGPQSPFTLTNGAKYKFRARIKGKWLFMLLYNEAGTLIAQRQAYDSRLPLVIGRGGFFETFDTSPNLAYDQVWARKSEDFTVPTISPNADTFFPSNTSPLVISPFGAAGGGITWVNGNAARVTTNGNQASGFGVIVGAVVAGTRIHACVDVSATSGNLISGITPNGLAGPISSIEAIPGVGRHIFDFVCSAPSAEAIWLIGEGGGSPRTFDVRGVFILKDGPTSFI